MKYLILALALTLFQAGNSENKKATQVEITEWQVPWENTRPRDPDVDEKGRVWFVGQRDDYVAWLDPDTGEFTRHDLEDGAGPHNLIVDEEGSIWYAGNRASHIGKMHPETGEITKYMMPDPSVRDPHTLVLDQNKDIWFTAQGSNVVGKFTRSDESIEIIPVPTERARPYGISIDSNNRPWLNLFGTNKLATIDPQSMELEEIRLPREDARSRRIAITSDDNIWYCDYAKGYLGRMDQGNREITEWELPSGESSRPYAMTVDNKDRLWMVESGSSPNLLVGFDPETEEFFSVTEIESGGGTVRHMIFHEPSNQIWFGTDTNYIGTAYLE
ncbi:MAG: hypothetical protein WD267_02680 [Balneolales bacterium]